ncbi:DUF928 domain-containing protein [Phormidium sp. CCY1219]|uniref:DUF928 domain-containing protein n=1 Tax=Phormidium sp. CCY1219 TaxID=2886104 RepID=UPI002D1E9F8B|nr:DUF928 domain-containing protein [Phormidium sp. CCY1219]MEB3831930.1 DUF928 domain-containing protein [Phormidium sp. CCY1219]
MQLDPKKLAVCRSILTVSVGLTSISFTFFPWSVMEMIFLPDEWQSAIAQTDDFVPPDDGRPTNRRAGGRRGSCNLANSPIEVNLQAEEIPLTALVPLTQTTRAKIPGDRQNSLAWEMSSLEVQETVVGTTLQQRPLVWVYIPPIYQGATTGKLIIQDEHNNSILAEAIEIELSQSAGIISVPFPADVLEPDRHYHWYFEIVCDSTHRFKNPIVDGWIQYQDNPELRQKIEQATSEAEKLRFYRVYGLWYDRLTFVAENRRQNPADSEGYEAWTQLLEYAELNDLKDEPLLQCCSVKTQQMYSLDMRANVWGNSHQMMSAHSIPLF